MTKITVSVSVEDDIPASELVSRIGTAFSWYNDNCPHGEELVIFFG